MFLNTEDTSIEQGKCSEQLLDLHEDDECLCQESSVIDVLCENERNNCDLPRCLEPIQPIGHCCKICGGLAQIEYLSGFNVSLGKLKEKIDKQIRMSEYNRADVEYHVSVVRDSILKKRWIQLVIVDKHEYQEISTKLLAVLKKTLLQQIYKGECFKFNQLQH
jgi:protein amnionless